jgi:hypothetical protein
MKLASEVVAGDRIKIGGDPFRRVVTAVPSSTHAIKPDGTKIPYVEFTFAKGVKGPLGTTYSLGVVKDSYVTLAMTPEAQAEAFAYARTLKGCTVIE